MRRGGGPGSLRSARQGRTGLEPPTAGEPSGMQGLQEGRDPPRFCCRPRHGLTEAAARSPCSSWGQIRSSNRSTAWT